MESFKQRLKTNIEKEGLDYKKAFTIYTTFFKTVQDTIRLETHKYQLYDTQLLIVMPFLGRFISRRVYNTKRHRKKLNQLNKLKNA